MEPTKERIDRLIDSLGTMTLEEATDGQRFIEKYLAPPNVVVRVYIGDVLAAGEEKIDHISYKKVLKLLELWRDCGKQGDNAFKKSLQEIFEGCKWRALHESTYGMRWLQARNLSTPKDPNIRALASLLLTLFPDV